MFDMNSIGKKISVLRKKSNLTQMELADKLGISFQAVSNWERGDTMPDISKLPELSEIFQVSIDEILGNVQDAKIVEAIIKNDDKPSNITANELVDVSPILKPNQVNKIFNNISGVNLNDLVSLAPFLNEETLSQAARKLFSEDETGSNIVKLAPFLSTEIIDEFSINVEDIKMLLPFMSKEGITNWGRRAYQKLGINEIVTLAPFASKEFLDEIANAEIEKNGVDALMPILPFLGKNYMNNLVNKMFSKK